MGKNPHLKHSLNTRNALFFKHFFRIININEQITAMFIFRVTICFFTNVIHQKRSKEIQKRNVCLQRPVTTWFSCIMFITKTHLSYLSSNKVVPLIGPQILSLICIKFSVKRGEIMLEFCSIISVIFVPPRWPDGPNCFVKSGPFYIATWDLI